MRDIKIVIDTSADMPQETADKYGFGMLRFMSVFGEKSFVTGVDITNEEFFQKLVESDVPPTTAQTPYGDMHDYLLDECKNHEVVIYFALSSKGSGQYNTARLVKNEIEEEYPEAKLYVVDTMTYSVYVSRMAMYAYDLVQKGEEDPEVIIKKSVDAIKDWKCFFLVDTLKYLEKGGRITKTTAIVGNLLDIKPILGVDDGLIAPHDKLRGNKKLVDKLIAKVEADESVDLENPGFLIIHYNLEKATEAKEKLEAKYGEGCVEIFVEFGPIIGTHVGPGAFAIIAKNKQ